MSDVFLSLSAAHWSIWSFIYLRQYVLQLNHFRIFLSKVYTSLSSRLEGGNSQIQGKKQNRAFLLTPCGVVIDCNGFWWNWTLNEFTQFKYLNLTYSILRLKIIIICSYPSGIYMKLIRKLKPFHSVYNTIAQLHECERKKTKREKNNNN